MPHTLSRWRRADQVNAAGSLSVPPIAVRHARAAICALTLVRAADYFFEVLE
jgi:hypothetical protein